MKIKLLLLNALLCSSTVYGATIAPPSDLQTGLVLYMNFDSSKGAYDSYTGYGSNLPAWGTGSNPTINSSGAFGSAGFNPGGSHPGSSSISSANISAQNFTVSFQFKDWAMAQDSFALRMKTTAGDELKFQSYTESGEANRLFQLFVAGGGAGFIGGVPRDQIQNISSWQTFTMTSSASGIGLYLNGNLIVQSNKTLRDGLLSFFQLGCNDSATNSAGFKTDDFGLWNRALTAEEIKFLANNTASTVMANAAVPEPGTATLALLGLSGFLINRRRSRNS